MTKGEKKKEGVKTEKEISSNCLGETSTVADVNIDTLGMQVFLPLLELRRAFPTPSYPNFFRSGQYTITFSLKEPNLHETWMILG